VGAYRVIRGGYWDDEENNLHVAIRNSNAPSARFYSIGFRLAKSR